MTEPVSSVCTGRLEHGDGSATPVCMKTHRSLLGWMLAVACLQLGCSKGSEPGAGSTSSGASSAQAAAKAAGEFRQICEKICDKTVECSLAIAKEAAKDAPDKEAASKAVADEEKAAKEGLAECKKECTSGQPTDADKAQMSDAKACTDKSDCKQFMDCFEKLGTGKK